MNNPKAFIELDIAQGTLTLLVNSQPERETNTRNILS